MDSDRGQSGCPPSSVYLGRRSLSPQDVAGPVAVTSLAGQCTRGKLTSCVPCRCVADRRNRLLDRYQPERGGRHFLCGAPLPPVFSASTATMIATTEATTPVAMTPTKN